MTNKQSEKMTFREFLGKLVPFVMLLAIYVALRGVFEFGLGYKDVPFLLCAFAMVFLIEAIKTKHLQLICTVIAAGLFGATFYVANDGWYWALMASGIVAMIVAARSSKTNQSAASGN